MPTVLHPARQTDRPAQAAGAFRRTCSRWITGLTAANAVLVAALLLLLCVVSEDWWFSAALSYLPRLPWLLPSLLLALPAFFVRGSLVLVNLLAALIVAGPIMGATAPLAAAPLPADAERVFTVVSCNVQNGAGDFERLLAEIEEYEPDVVALQETLWGVSSLEGRFPEWHTLHVGEFWVGSRYPLRLVDECVADSFDRRTAIVCEVDTPDGTVLFCNLHLNTARHGLTGLQWHSLLSGDGVDDFEWRQWQRRLEAEETREFLAAYPGRPLLIAGDFNTPTSSSLYTDVWSGYGDAFASAGWGYGYTAPCNTSRLWPENTPWLRIDHILCDDAWHIHECRIGRSNYSDHRLVAARLSLR